MQRLLKRARESGYLQDSAAIALTESGLKSAARAVRNHRLWEMYLIAHADIAPSHVDRDADMIEHVLNPAMIAELEDLLDENLLDEKRQGVALEVSPTVPASPHLLPVAE